MENAHLEGIRADELFEAPRPVHDNEAMVTLVTTARSQLPDEHLRREASRLAQTHG